ncbi:hypothetical protein TNIN_42481 [Trichonephila inaurata madagascariensis]|uniref:Uncharacterized protein n=1 Tax=Trichonephila inaurata madagascariensis TaxID=2747483 RepID=A0A8X7CGH5_9ARAC|nr:hypothetical protein TNIN_42481 [Trichonephila inaurata madagascariensis]
MIPSNISASLSSWLFEMTKVCYTGVGKRCINRNFSNSSDILQPALLLISNNRLEGLRSPSCIPEISPRKCCSSVSAYCEQSLFWRVAYGFTAGGFKIISPTIPNSSGCNAETTW